MKSLKLYLFLALIISVSPKYLPQISDITRLPVQNKNEKYLESAPIAVTNTELLVFFATNRSYADPYIHLENDTIFSIRSFDGGITWQKPEFIFEIIKSYLSVYDPYYLSSLKTSNGRIVLCWVDRPIGKIAIIHSDDNGYSWSDTIQVKGGGSSNYLQRASLYDLNLSEINSGRLILSFNRKNGSEIYYRESVDNGETWSSNTYGFNNISGKIRCLSMIELDEDKISAFFEYEIAGIYKMISTDGGVIWSNPVQVIDLPEKEYRPRVLKFNSNQLWLIYEVLDDTLMNARQTDIYFSRSFDGGESWINPQRFTRYVGEDRYLNAVIVDENLFITFSTTRFTNKDQISYAILGETTETFKPPYITNASATIDSVENKKWLVACTVTDDEEVVFASVEFEDGSTTQLYDDGKHNDSDSADYVYGNTISFEYYSPSETELMNVNKLQLPFDNSGVLADLVVSLNNNSVFRAIDNSNYSTELITPLEVTYSSGARYDEGIFLFSGGFGLSGYTNGALWANAQATASRIINYLPGRVGDDPENPPNKIYTVYASDPPFGFSWQRWKDAVSLGADFYDGDSDGIYNPVDKNWNGIWDPNEDMPDLLGDITAWCIFNDGVPASVRERFTGIEPQGIEVEQTLFASTQPELENIIFLRYKLTNKGTAADVLDSVIFSFWADPDLGDHTNDLFGSDTMYESCFTYNDSSDNVYGNNPPVHFITLLQGAIIESEDATSIAINNNGPLLGVEEFIGKSNLKVSSTANFFSPHWQYIELAYNFRNRMKGLHPYGDRLDPCTFNLGEVRGGIDCNSVNPLFWYSGNPVEDIGWINITPTDQRTMLSVGEFTLEKDKPVTIIGAYVLGRGTDALNSITIARENVQRAIQEYQSNFASLTYNPGEPVYPVVNYDLYQNYPNPFNPTTTIRYELPQDGVVTIDIYDILGQKVKTILNEFQKADRYEISFNAISLASGVYIYQLRVNDFITSKKMLLIK